MLYIDRTKTCETVILYFKAIKMKEENKSSSNDLILSLQKFQTIWCVRELDLNYGLIIMKNVIDRPKIKEDNELNNI